MQRYRDGVYLLPGSVEITATESRPIRPGETVELPAGQGQFWLAPAVAEGIRLGPADHLQLAWRQGGERCRLPGRQRTASVKKLLQAHDIPPWWRDRVPLLYLRGELLAVGDLWLCHSSRLFDPAGSAETLWQPHWKRNITTAFD